MKIIGNVYVLQNCKHSWNNGIEVKIIGEEKKLEFNDNLILYNAVDIKNPDNLFIVDANNLKKDK